ncbi:helix-turn-helix domain-containing protein [Jatrophihabitans telluris]|uniref:Helix-turn-helix domain-containing protein n=1 Tax=Jatrophihabitans telluris TaxID=2038343 RepID=A0ABY4R240_9ACTN|nr:helix-turn-helix domain-containing protein [Jatrophihabitans telluris]UQX89205.1 helix-turn-helix domain-containing protein [Jatrophihabitans telluris]
MPSRHALTATQAQHESPTPAEGGAPSERLLTFAETARRIGHSDEALRAMRKTGSAPPFFKLGKRKLVIRESALTDWITAQEAAK